MKKICLLFVLALSHLLYAEDFDGKYWGELKNAKAVDEKIYFFETTYTLKEGAYTLEIQDCSDKFNAFRIPEKHIAEKGGLKTYSESGSFTTKNVDGFLYISFENAKPFQVADSFLIWFWSRRKCMNKVITGNALFEAFRKFS